MVLAFTLFNSCALFIPGYNDYASAKKYYEKGQYDLAVHAVIKSLRFKPDDEKRIALLEAVYPMAVDVHQNEIRRLGQLSNTAKWPKLVRSYEALQRLVYGVNSIKPVLINRVNYTLILNVIDYTANIEAAKPKAADHHYQMGLKFKKGETKQEQKAAAIQFKLAMGFIPDYQNTATLYAEARENAIFTLLVSRFKGDGNITNYLRDQMMGAQTTLSKEFLRIISRDQLRSIMSEQGLVQAGITDNNYLEIGKLSGADHILTASTTTTHRPVEKIKNQYDQEREVTIRKETYVDSAGVKRTKHIKGKVKAKVRHFKKSTGGTLNVTYQIIDVNTGEMLFQGSMNRREDFHHEWATYRGDVRALSDRYQWLVKQEETFAPSKSDMMMKMARLIPKEFHLKIDTHYSN